MGKKANRFTRSEAARHTPGARIRPAASRLWPDLPLNHPRVESGVSVLRRSNRRRIATESPRKGLHGPSRAVSFGTWSLPPSVSTPRLQAASTCARRYVRRSVLFASRSTGAGSKARRLHFSNRRC